MSLYSSTNSQQRVNFKVVVVGGRDVGKTTLVLRYVKGEFNLGYAATVGVEFYSKNRWDEEEGYSLQLWDTAGQESFRSLMKSLYNRASCVILSYCNPTQLQKEILSKLNAIREYTSKETCVFVVRTKIDLCQVKEEERNFMQGLIARGQVEGWMEVSAKFNTNVDEFFGLVFTHLIRKYKHNLEFRQFVQPSKNQISIRISKQSVFECSQYAKKRSCCQ